MKPEQIRAIMDAARARGAIRDSGVSSPVQMTPQRALYPMDADTLTRIARLKGSLQTTTTIDVVRRCVLTIDELRNVQERGARLFIESADGRTRVEWFV